MLAENDDKFTVLGSAESLCGRLLSCPHEVTVIVNNLDIVIKRGGAVSVFGIDRDSPYRKRGKKISYVSSINAGSI